VESPEFSDANHAKLNESNPDTHGLDRFVDKFAHIRVIRVAAALQVSTASVHCLVELSSFTEFPEEANLS